MPSSESRHLAEVPEGRTWSALNSAARALLLQLKSVSRSDIRRVRGCLHLDAAVVAAGSQHTRVGRVPSYRVASWAVALQSLYSRPRVLVPDENVAVFAAANDKPLVGATKRAADQKVAAGVAEEFLLVNLGLNLNELCLAVALVDQHVFRVLADADGCRARLELVLVDEFSCLGVVDVVRLLVVDGDEPTSVG